MSPEGIAGDSADAADEVTERDPFTGMATAGRLGPLHWRLGPDGVVRHPDGAAYTVDEMRQLGNGVDRLAGRTVDDVAAEEIDLGQGATWLRADRDQLFARLRAELPVSPQRGIPFLAGTGDLDWWAVTRHADVTYVSRHPELFASGRGGTNLGDIPDELAEFLGSIINMDAPRHTKLRRLVSAGFTPRQVASLDDAVRHRASHIVDAIAEQGHCDVVRDIAAPLPLQVICDMMGIPPEDEQRMFELSNVILGFGDPEYVTGVGDLVGAGMELFQYGLALAEARQRQPRDDIATALVHAEVDGERLTAQELGSFFVLLVVAGNETTRTAISHGLLALTNFPDQRQRWLADLAGVGPTAVEEIVRWATPVIHFRRTATAEVELGGQRIAEGDRVVLMYLAANRDEATFANPFAFDVTRNPNDHVGFGAGGPHFCLGANLARREIRVMFDELLRRIPDIAVTGEPDRLRSAFINGIKRMPAEFTPVRAS
jgi:methyl-branched lipid omega-hydroxylase